MRIIKLENMFGAMCDANDYETHHEAVCFETSLKDLETYLRAQKAAAVRKRALSKAKREEKE